jgi:hypothetical protein
MFCSSEAPDKKLLARGFFVSKPGFLVMVCGKGEDLAGINH